MFGIGGPELVFIFVLALLIFGPKRLPQIGRTIGKGMAEFRRASTELQRAVNTELEEPPAWRSQPAAATAAPAAAAAAAPATGAIVEVAATPAAAPAAAREESVEARAVVAAAPASTGPAEDVAVAAALDDFAAQLAEDSAAAEPDPTTPTQAQ